MIQFKTLIKDFNDFDTKIIQKIKSETKSDDVEWLSDGVRYYSINALCFILKNKYDRRIPLWEEDEFIGYFINRFMQYTPMFYARVSAIIENKVSELQENENVGKRTTMATESNRGASSRQFGNGKLDDADVPLDARERSKYTMDSSSDNRVDNAKKLASIEISGEVENYVESFGDLFTQTNMEDSVPTGTNYINALNDVIIQTVKNTEEIETVETDVKKNTDNIAVNTASVNSVKTDVKKNTDNIALNVASINTVKSEVLEVKKDLDDKDYILKVLGYKEEELTSDEITVVPVPGGSFDFLNTDKVSARPLAIDLTAFDGVELSFDFGNDNRSTIRLTTNGEKFSMIGSDPFSQLNRGNGILNLMEVFYNSTQKQLEIDSYERLEYFNSGSTDDNDPVTWKYRPREKILLYNIVGYKLVKKTVLVKE